jgi:predicted RNA binding protein YcfA (HicA-like mRNA interferase family)
MPSLPVVSGAEAVRALERLAFVFARQRGSHMVLRADHKAASCRIIVNSRRERFQACSNKPVFPLRNLSLRSRVE